MVCVFFYQRCRRPSCRCRDRSRRTSVENAAISFCCHQSSKRPSLNVRLPDRSAARAAATCLRTSRPANNTTKSTHQPSKQHQQRKDYVCFVTTPFRPQRAAKKKKKMRRETERVQTQRTGDRSCLAAASACTTSRRSCTPIVDTYSGFRYIVESLLNDADLYQRRASVSMR